MGWLSDVVVVGLIHVSMVNVWFRFIGGRFMYWLFPLNCSALPSCPVVHVALVMFPLLFCPDVSYAIVPVPSFRFISRSVVVVFVVGAWHVGMVFCHGVVHVVPLNMLVVIVPVAVLHW